MAKEYYSSLYKGTCHVTTPFSSSHNGIDTGNYKTRNKLYSPVKLGYGKVVKIATTDTYLGKIYTGCWNVWVQYDWGRKMMFLHGYKKDGFLKVGDKIKVGQHFYVSGNSGYSFGDHTHSTLWVKKNGKDVAVNCSHLLLNDKVDLLPIGTKLYIKDTMNLRRNDYSVIAQVHKGAVCKIVSYRGYYKEYWWYGVKFADGKTGILAKSTRNSVTTKELTVLK